MEFQFRLSNPTNLTPVIVSEPKGWLDASLHISEDSDFKGLVKNWVTDLTFWGDGYDYIKNLFDNAGFCNVIDVDIYSKPQNGVFSLFYQGSMFITQCKFDLCKCLVDVSIVNNNITKYISNNKEIKAYLAGTFTKNGVSIGASVTVADFFDVDGFPVYMFKHGYTIYEAFEYMVAYVSDNDLKFKSDYFSTGDGKYFVLYTGNELAVQSTAGQGLLENSPNISLKELFQEVDKKFNIRMGFEVIAGVPTIVVEEADYFEKSTPLFNLTNVPNVVLSFDEKMLYSQVKISGGATQEGGSLPNVRFVTFNDEDFNILGTCNIDNTLDITSQWIVDSNTIEGTLDGTIDGDESIFIVEFTDPTTVARWVNPLGLPNTNSNFPAGTYPLHAYNEHLTNAYVLQRYLGAIPNDVIKYINPNATFKSEIPTDINPPFGATYSIDGTAFSNELSDPQSAYNPVNGRYTALQEGVFQFHCAITVDNSIPSATLNLNQITIKRYDSGGTLLYTSLADDTPPFAVIPSGTSTIAYTLTAIYGQAGDYFTFDFDFTDIGGNFISVTIIAGSYIECTSSFVDNNDGTWETYDPNLVKVLKYGFTAPIDCAQLDLLNNDLTKAIGFDICGENATTGNIISLEMPIKSLKAEWELRQSITP